jgi:RNA ligase
VLISWPDVPKTIACKEFNPKHILSLANDGDEGFVVRWLHEEKPPFRLKLKTEEYLRLHRIVTNFSEKRVWEALSSGIGLSEFLTNVPDEFYNQVKDAEAKILGLYHDIEMRARNAVDSAKLASVGTWDRKQFAFKFTLQYPDIAPLCFNLLDNQEKKFSEQVWKRVGTML